MESRTLTTIIIVLHCSIVQSPLNWFLFNRNCFLVFFTVLRSLSLSLTSPCPIYLLIPFKCNSLYRAFLLICLWIILHAISRISSFPNIPFSAHFSSPLALFASSLRTIVSFRFTVTSAFGFSIDFQLIRTRLHRVWFLFFHCCDFDVAVVIIVYRKNHSNAYVIHKNHSLLLIMPSKLCVFLCPPLCALHRISHKYSHPPLSIHLPSIHNIAHSLHWFRIDAIPKTPITTTTRTTQKKMNPKRYNVYYAAQIDIH